MEETVRNIHDVLQISQKYPLLHNRSDLHHLRRQHTFKSWAACYRSRKPSEIYLCAGE